MEKNWTKEFYRQFPSLIHYQGADERKRVIKFIEKLLSQKAQEVEKLKKEYNPDTTERLFIDPVAVDGYNQACDDIVALFIPTTQL